MQKSVGTKGNKMKVKCRRINWEMTLQIARDEERGAKKGKEVS